MCLRLIRYRMVPKKKENGKEKWYKKRIKREKKIRVIQRCGGAPETDIIPFILYTIGVVIPLK